MAKKLSREQIDKFYEKYKKHEPLKELTFDIDREAIDEENQIVPMSVSSDKPYRRWFGWETLDHKSKSIRLERFKNKAAFRDTHFGDQVGVILNPRIDKEQGKLRVDVQFSKNDPRAITLYKDIKDGIRQNVSVRYMVHEMVLEKETDEESFYRVTDWEPIHASLEPDPADDSVGPNRSADDEGDNLTEEEKQELRKIININKQHSRGNNKMTPEEREQLEKKQAEDIKAAADKATKGEQLRVKNIYTLANKFHGQVKEGFDIHAEASKAVAEGKSADEFSDVVFQSIQQQAALRTNDAKIGMSEEEVRVFSISRAVNAAIDGNWDKAQFEREVIMAAKAKQPVSRNSQITIPYDVLISKQFAQREMTVGSATAGGNLVGTNLMASAFIDVLRNRSVTGLVNVTFMDGLVGNVAIPKKTAAGSAGWISAEGGDASDINMTFGQVSLSPKTVGARSEFTRQLLLQSTPAIDRLLEDDLMKDIAIAVDAGLLHGSAASGQPRGIANQSGIGSVDSSGGFTYADLVEFKTDVKTANAYKQNMAYITTPAVEGTLEVTPKSGTYPVFMLQDGKAAGHPLHSTNQCSANHIFFGDWSQAVIGLWGGLDIIVDAISSNDGNVKFKAFQSVDVAVRQAGAFSLCSNFATS